MLNVCLLTPKRHILARNRVVWRIARENWFRRLGCSSLEEPKKKKPSKHFDAQFRAYGGKKPWRDRDYILHVGRYPWRNHVCNFLWRSVKGFGGGKGSNFPFSHWLASSPLQHSRTIYIPCECVIQTTYLTMSRWPSDCPIYGRPAIMNLNPLPTVADLLIDYQWIRFDLQTRPKRKLLFQIYLVCW